MLQPPGRFSTPQIMRLLEANDGHDDGLLTPGGDEMTGETRE
jgi:hypothetical protein